MDKEKLLTQVKDEINYSRNFIQRKRDMFRNRFDKYINPDKDEDKVSVNTLYSTMQLFLSINYSDKLSVLFMPRRLGDEEYADNLTDLAKFDYDEMNMEVINFQKDWDRAFFGVGIRVKDGWDDIRKCPIWSVKDPLSWLPDPRGNHLDKFRFHYFEEEMMKEDMEEELGFIESEVEKLNYERNEELETNRSFLDNAQGLNNNTEEEIDANQLIPIYNGYTIFEGEKYLVTVDNKLQTILRAVKIDAVKAEEKKEEDLIEFPVNVSWFSPYRGDPFGVSLADLVEDKQKANSILLNLQLINSKYNTLGQTYLIDPRAVPNKADLLSPSTDPKWIPFNSASGVPISNAIYPIPRPNIQADSFNMVQELSRQLQLDTGVDARTLWVQWDKSITLGESQTIQANANVRLGLNITVNNWSEKDFWKQWYRCYQEYFSGKDRKFIRIAGSFSVSNVEFRKDDFMGNEDVDVVIESESQVKAMREQQKLQFQAQLPIILQDPSTTEISKNYAKRYSYKLMWLTRDQIAVLVPYTYEELDAMMKVKLINANDPLALELDELDVDHYTYLIYADTALDTPMKYKFIEQRKRAIIQTGQNLKQQPEQMWWAANAASAQMTSAAISGAGKPQSSLQQLTQ